MEQGFNATTVRQVATRAAVSVGTVMGVADKDGLLVSVVDRRIAGIEPVDQQDGRDATTQISHLLGEFVRFCGAHPELARAYAAVLVGGRHRSSVFTDLTTTLVEQVSAVLTHAGHPPADAAAIARVVHRAYLGELFIWAGQGVTDPTRTLAELETTVRYLVTREA